MSTSAELERVAEILLRRPNLENELATAVRDAIDFVLDGAHTGRYSIDQLDKTEKTYIGTKVEQYIIHRLRLPKHQRLDTRIGGVPVDIKCTIGTNWEIPVEAMHEICLVVRIDEAQSKYWAGLVLITPDKLNRGSNRDRKRKLNARGRHSIKWLIEGASFPRNLLYSLTEEDRKAILDPNKSATQRMAELFRRCVGVVVDQRTVDTVGRQRDSSKRVRGNGGARDILSREGILILTNKKETNDWLVRRGFPRLKKGQFLSIRTCDVETSPDV